MSPTHPRTPSTSPTRAAAWVALLVLALGLPQLLVLCRGTDGSHRLEFAGDAASCCADDHGAPVGDDEGLPRLEPEHGCQHTSFSVELLPVPRNDAGAGPDDAPTAWQAASLDDARATPPPTAPRPPSTGPPRPDPQTALLATTLLLL